MRTNLTAFRVMFFSGLLLMTACKKNKDNPTNSVNNNTPNTVGDHGLGYSGTDDVGHTPSSIGFNFGAGNLPASADITDKFPPIGNQGQYGTCVAWATAYNLKTTLDGMQNNWSASELASPAYQSSPRDLFTALPDDKKGPNCDGTNFSDALGLIQDRGVATLQTVPYSNLGDCSQQNVQSSWTQEASGRKIQYWRKLDPTIDNIKQNIANNIPVVFGARLADNFIAWNSDNVLTSGTSFVNVGIHNGHAMSISGYDDSKGPNGAFKVVNSWGTQWGANGYIWVDYNYFITDFCLDDSGDHPLFIAADGDGGNNPPGPDPSAGGVDLAPWVFDDYSTGNANDYTERQIDLNVYNIGTQDATPDANWSVYYIYFNAYDANDYGVIFYDEFNTTVAQNTYNCPEDYHCIFNVDVPAGNDFATYAFGTSDVVRTYYMPQITGDYYLALIADAGDVFQEQDELNNIFYTTLVPKYFESGYSKSMGTEFNFHNELQPQTSVLQKSKYNSVVTRQNPNAYTTREIEQLINREKKNGHLAAKIRDYLQAKKQQTKMYPNEK